ncbi:MAG: hypothetical protein NDI91_17320 [Sulfuritalea sp.]|nr:hypothetical protein [Sulfuritalea sp.]
MTNYRNQSYRNHPGGMVGMCEDITRNSRPVYLEDVLAIGNRSQRRWAKKRLEKIERSQAGASADVSTSSEIHRAAPGATLQPTKGNDK